MGHLTLRQARSLALELGLPLCLATAFAFAYQRTPPFAPLSAVGSHVAIVGLFFVSALIGRVMFHRASVGAGEITARAGALIHGLVLWLLALYYAFVFIGLGYWSEVPTRGLVQAYVPHVAAISENLQLPLLPVGLGILAVLPALIAFSWATSFKHDPARALATRVRPSLVLSLVLCVLAGWTLLYQRAVLGDLSREREPLALSFFPREYAHQTHILAPEKRIALAKAENAARAGLTRAPVTSRPNVIVVIADALRPANLSFYGYHRNTMPRLAKRHGDGEMRVLKEARAICAESFCGTMAVLASRDVHNLPHNPITLHEVLARHGYRTHLITSADHENFYGLRDTLGPFDFYADSTSSPAGFHPNDDALVLNFLDEIPKASDEPAFFYFHLMSSHPMGTRRPELEAFRPQRNYSFRLRDVHFQPGDPQNPYWNFYDNGVLTLDFYLDALLQRLDALGYLEHSIVAITADHGEALGEHGLFRHSNSVREPVLRVPTLFLSSDAAMREALHDSDLPPFLGPPATL